MDSAALWLTLKLASWTTFALLLIGLPLGYWLGRTPWKWRFLVEAVVGLPLVLPPTVVGFYLLIATGPHSAVGRAYETLTGGMLPFSFQGILLASVLFNLPFAVRPFAASFATIDQRLLEASWCLGVSRFMTFIRVACPIAWPGILTGIVLTFAHTVGEFGVVLMMGGNIPGETRTLSISIYDDVQSLEYASAHQTAFVLLLFSFVALTITYSLQRRMVTL